MTENKIRNLISRLHQLENTLSGQAREHAINYQYELESMIAIIHQGCEASIGNQQGVIENVEQLLNENE